MTARHATAQLTQKPHEAGPSALGSRRHETSWVRQNCARWLLYHVSSSTFWMEPDVWNIGNAELWNLYPLVHTRFIKNCQSDYIIRGHNFRTTHTHTHTQKAIIQQTSHHTNFQQTKTTKNLNLTKKSVKIPNIKFHENPSSGNRFAACGLTWLS